VADAAGRKSFLDRAFDLIGAPSLGAGPKRDVGTHDIEDDLCFGVLEEISRMPGNFTWATLHRIDAPDPDVARNRAAVEMGDETAKRS